MIPRLIERVITKWIDWFGDPIRTPILEEGIQIPLTPEPPNDGRLFGWQRTRGAALAKAMPIIVFDEIPPHVEIVGMLYALHPSEYRDDLTTLARRYPMPKIAED